MDRNATPWRALEAPSPTDQTTPASAPGGFSPDLAGVPVPWVVGGAAIVMVGLALAGVLLVGGGSPQVAVPSSVGGGSADPGGSLSAADSSFGRGEVIVEVAGAVVHPGVYRLGAGQRVADAIAAAGGYGPRVDATRATARLNLAARLADGDRVLVPSRDDPAGDASPPTTAGGSTADGSGSGGGGGAGGSTATGPIDLNRATATELDSLPGIGPVTAAKIIAARTDQPFTAVDDLRTRKLVGPSTFEKLRDLVTVR